MLREGVKEKRVFYGQADQKAQSGIKCGVGSQRTFDIFFISQCGIKFVRDKKCCILLFRDKKCHI